jgi:hypothetical protein
MAPGTRIENTMKRSTIVAATAAVALTALAAPGVAGARPAPRSKAVPVQHGVPRAPTTVFLSHPVSVRSPRHYALAALQG